MNLRSLSINNTKQQLASIVSIFLAQQLSMKKKIIIYGFGIWEENQTFAKFGRVTTQNVMDLSLSLTGESKKEFNV